MRSSFYSTKNAGFFEEKGEIVDSLKVQNVLEMGEVEMDKIQRIRDFMLEQADGLQKEIDDLQS